jgi:hypothetical protein
LKTLHFIFIAGRGHDGWLRLLPVLTPTKSTTTIFPNLQDAVFSCIGGPPLEYTDEHYKLLRDFVLARNGVLSRLSIPPMENMDILDPLKDHIAHFEVCFQLVLLLSAFSHLFFLGFKMCSLPYFF